MILQALVDYYDRRCALDPDAMPRLGWERKALPFIIEITPDGRFVQIVDTRPAEGKPRRGAEFVVPKAVVRTSGVAANLLWDNVEYALGVSAEGPGKRCSESHEAFLKAIRQSFGSEPADEGVLALLRFQSELPYLEMQSDPFWDEMVASNPFISFRLAGRVRLICQCELPDSIDQNLPRRRCLVTGSEVPIERIHPPVKGVRGGNPGGMPLVSFQHPSAYESYGKEQGDNAPVGKEAAFKYTTALNDLLAANSHRKTWLADSTFVFWAERQAGEIVENAVASLFSEPPKDDPDRNSAAIRDVLAALSDGSWTAVPDGNGRFYLLGLAPNSGRVAVRTWMVATASETARRLTDHFKDLEIDKPTFAQEHPSLFRLLCSVAVQGKSENIPPNLEAEVVQAILTGQPYPITLLAAAVHRSYAEPRPSQRGRERTEWELRSYRRAAVIKAVVNRHRRAAGQAQEELKVSLDTANPASAYRLGRLFAALEKAQEEASPGLNATIRDRYYGAASSTPVTVFPRLLDLKNHHIAKIESPGRRVHLERLIGEIVDGIPRIPAHLTLIEQGDFAIGYYHQRQDFFKKHSSDDGENN